MSQQIKNHSGKGIRGEEKIAPVERVVQPTAGWTNARGNQPRSMNE
jgi:hypothetical protein